MKKDAIKNFILVLLTVFLLFIIIGAKHPRPVISEYLVNSYSEMDNLEKWVNKKIKKGWQPTGGISISHLKNSGNWNIYYSQAMVKY